MFLRSKNEREYGYGRIMQAYDKGLLRLVFLANSEIEKKLL
jgi:hypothetical protein